MTEKKFVAPDGGWGWVIVAAFAISNGTALVIILYLFLKYLIVLFFSLCIIIPSLQSYGLLYRNVFIELGFTATDISTIINVNSAFGLILGLFIGPLLKIYGYRKVAMVGSLLTFAGFALCSFAYSITEFIIFYGIINSAGFSATLAAYGLALNTYFSKKRNLASGLCTAFTGLGPVMMPFLISFLLDVYGVRGTALILSGLLLNSFVGALLLQPVKWHIPKEPVINEKELELLNPEAAKISISITNVNKEEDETEENEVFDNYDCKSVHGMENSVMPPMKTTENGIGGLYASKQSLNDKTLSADSTWWRRASNSAPRPSVSSLKSIKKKPDSMAKKIVKLFDFDLLKDAGYRNIWLGMSLAFTGEINFSLMTPLILGDKGMSIEQTAQLMSAIASTDIVFRFISPFIGDYLKWSAKHMYMGSLVCLVITRSCLTVVHGYKQIMMACLVIGVAKGLRTVYMALVIPSYVSLEKLPSASGLQTLLNGLLLIGVGPFLGYLRDSVGNYDVCIHVINTFSLITIILWTTELLLSLRKSKTNQQEAATSPET